MDLSPFLESRARAVAVAGLSTVRAIRVCICPASATGRSGVMLTVAPPTCSSEALHSLVATSIERVATVQNVHDGLIGLAVGIPGVLMLVFVKTANPLTNAVTASV